MTGTRATLEKDPREVARMFDTVAARYDLTNDVMAFGQTRRWRRLVFQAVGARPGDRVLDIAAGTATSSVPFADAGVRVVAADFSLGMLREGRRRRPDIDLVAADAMRLPFADEAFDAVTASFGLRNVADTQAALREFRRVTRPGGRLVICEFSTPTVPGFRQVYENYLIAALPRIAARVGSNADSYQYLSESIRAWPHQRGLAEIMAEAGWRDVAWRNLSGGVVALHRATRD